MAIGASELEGHLLQKQLSAGKAVWFNPFLVPPPPMSTLVNRVKMSRERSRDGRPALYLRVHEEFWSSGVFIQAGRTTPFGKSKRTLGKKK